MDCVYPLFSFTQDLVSSLSSSLSVSKFLITVLAVRTAEYGH